MENYMIYKVCTNSILLKYNINHRSSSFIGNDVYSNTVPKRDKKVLIAVIL